MNFTDKIANYILESEIDTKNLTIILPSERAQKYIAASLFKANNKALIAPKMITIDRWIRELSTANVIDKTRALLRLFEVQIKHAEKAIDTDFDEFLEWGGILLSDFDEIDRYLIEPKEVFRNLADIKKLDTWVLESWQGGKETLTESQKRFMEFWDRLPNYYQKLNESLQKDKLCYMGKAYREVSTNIQLAYQNNKDSKFIFAGFNALSEAEVSIMKQLKSLGKAEILIDADAFYLENKSHEAGQFINQFFQKMDSKKFSFIENTLRSDKKNIQIIECPQVTGQVKVASTHLSNLSKSEIDKTLVLLADETLISPLLQNLPQHVGKANITLGLPLKNSPIKNWVEIWFTIQENHARFSSKAIYHADLKRILSHPFIVKLASSEEISAIQRLEQSILKNNRIFLSLESLKLGEKLESIIQVLFGRWDRNWLLAVNKFRSLNARLYSLLPSESQFEWALIQGFDHAIVEFENIATEGLPTMSLRSFRTLFNQHWSNRSMSYHGNPIDGLQIMGLLETRLLDFENIIALGMNEGTLPPTNPIQSILPMDLRRYLNLPIPRDKQGLFAHHFYRLLHNCKNMLITYTSASESIGSNEQSRYLMQLELELARTNPNFIIERAYYSVEENDRTRSTENLTIKKTPEILARLDELFAKSTSASMLKNYFNCPKDFFYKHLLEFGEEDTVEEDVQANTFGTLVHETLEELYEPFALRKDNQDIPNRSKTQVTVRHLDNMIDSCELVLRNQFLKHFNQEASAFETGMNYIQFRTALNFVKRFLKSERKNLSEQNSLYIIALEETFEIDLELIIHGEMKRIHLKGIVDRIEEYNGKIRIIDYKSGVVKPEDLMYKIKREPDLCEQVLTPKYLLQLLIYSYLYKAKYGKLADDIGIYSFVKYASGLISIDTGTITLEELTDLFPVFLTKYLEEIYDPMIEFEHQKTGAVSYCSYCE